MLKKACIYVLKKGKIFFEICLKKLKYMHLHALNI
jgi:hypothetical protein